MPILIDLDKNSGRNRVREMSEGKDDVKPQGDFLSHSEVESTCPPARR
jgi:hypothetical protein